jgi:hypothetical protein
LQAWPTSLWEKTRGIPNSSRNFCWMWSKVYFMFPHFFSSKIKLIELMEFLDYSLASSSHMAANCVSILVELSLLVMTRQVGTCEFILSSELNPYPPTPLTLSPTFS